MPRYLIAFVISLAITLGLFFLMQSLIKMGGSALTEPPKGSVLDFVRVKQDEQVEKKDRKPKKPPKPEEHATANGAASNGLAADAEGTSMDFGAEVGDDISLEGGLALESGDGEYLPIRVCAVYPRRALQRGGVSLLLNLQ